MEDAKPPREPIRSLTPDGPIRPRYRLAIWITHPIQYQAPLFRKLAQHPQIDLTVYYGSDLGSVNRIDPEFGVSFQWDIPLLEGYRYKILRNYSWKRVPTGFWWVVNPEIALELARLKYDALIVHGYASATSWLAYLGAWLTRTPVLFRGETALHQQTVWKRAAKGIGLRFLFRHTAGCLAMGRRSAEFYRFYDTPQSKTFLAPYCVDNDFFIRLADHWRTTRRDIRQELGLPENLPIVLYCGKLIARKRPLDLIEAVSSLSTPTGLLFVGDGQLRSALEAEVLRRGLRHARFVGFRNQSALAPYYATADIFVFPSAFEPYGLVVNEAMCFALPIITTPAVAAAADLVRDGENGFLCAVGDIEMLTRNLNKLVGDPTLRREMGQRSREIISRWNYDTCVEGIVNALARVARKKHEDLSACCED